MYFAPIRSGLFFRLNDLPISKGQRELVNDYIQEGERVADLCCRALAIVRSGIALAGHRAYALARSVKAAFARPTR